MKIRDELRILGAALLLSVCTVRVSAAQEQWPAVPASAASAAKEKSISESGTAPEVSAFVRRPEGTASGLVGRFLNDQREIWTSPARLRFSDTKWLVPLSGITAGLFVTDPDFSKHLSRNPTTITRYNTLSNAGVGALVVVGSGMWLLGHASHNDHWSETGFLAGEAALNSLVAVESFKYSLRRERPYQGDGSGSFFQSSGTSFPSEHAAAAWSIAGVVAHEYPGPFTKILAYGLASLVDISRVRARQHFPSDVLVGSMIGNLVAQNVYSRHHDFDLGGGEWRSISQIFRGDSDHSPANQGSPYVSLDSWIYPALDRLAAMGLIDSGFAGMRPWTRNECARLLSEAEENVDDRAESSPQEQNLLSTLERELRPETEAGGGGQNEGVFRVESVYTRTEHISGMPLNDGYHTGQTLINDFGRPYGEGWSTLTGFSTYSTAGRWFGYVRGEWQTAPGTPPLPLAERQLIPQLDYFPAIEQQNLLPGVPPDIGKPSVSQFDLLEAYVGLNFSNWQVSYGRQSLLWGPGDGGSLMWSNNAAPLNMIRITRSSPLTLPWLLKWLGPMRVEFFLGQLRGQFFENDSHGFTGNYFQPLNPQPFVHGEELSFKPTPNFEFGFSRNAIFGGPSTPFTLNLFLHSLFSTFGGGDVSGSRTDSGDQQSALNWSYRLPKLRNWLTFYGDAFADDEPSPIAYFDRSAIHAGLYLSHVPGIPKLDLRAEGVYTDVPAGGALGHGFYYRSSLVLDGQTSDGHLLGSWVGREGQGAQAWTNYWFNARNRLQFNFRHQKVSAEFIPGGGTLTDVGILGDYWVRSNLGFSGWVKYEHWLFPIRQPNPATNVTAAVEIRFAPQKLFRKSPSNTPELSGETGGRR